MRLERLFNLIIIGLIVISPLLITNNTAEGVNNLTARGAVVIDSQTGHILFGHNPMMKLPMASTTKIMTALIAIERGDLDKRFEISKDAVGIEGSSIWLEEGEMLSLRELLYGLMLRSGNDAASAIAIAVAGSEKKFVEIMNGRAQDLGALNTNFMNPHGLHHEQHYTTPYDLALITREALKSDIFRKIITTRNVTIPWDGKEWNRAIVNKNRLLDSYTGADGVKTGYTRKSRSCLVSSATRNGNQIISVVLGSSNSTAMWNESKILLDYGFNNYNFERLLKKQQMLKRVNIQGAHINHLDITLNEDIVIPIIKGNDKEVTTVIELPDFLKAPIVEGQNLGSIKVLRNNEEIFSRNILSPKTIPKRTVISSFLELVELWVNLNSNIKH